MNREKRRRTEKQLRSRGVNQETIRSYMELLRDTNKSQDLGPVIPYGSHVKINLEKIQSRKEYDRLSKKYREFVERNSDTVFTAIVEKRGLISFQEAPEWLFWNGDLILLEDDAPMCMVGPMVEVEIEEEEAHE